MDRSRLVARKITEVFAAAAQRGKSGQATTITNDHFATLDASGQTPAPRLNMIIRPNGNANALGLQMMGIFFAYCGYEPSDLSRLVHAVPQEGELSGSISSDLGSLILNGGLSNPLPVEDMMIDMGGYAAQSLGLPKP